MKGSDKSKQMPFFFLLLLSLFDDFDDFDPSSSDAYCLTSFLFAFGTSEANLSTGTLFWLEVELSEVSYLARQETPWPGNKFWG